MKFSYPSEKFSTARRNLMLPHPRGEAEAISHAFAECSNGLHKLDRNDLDDDARMWVKKLEELMNYEDLDDPTEKGMFTIKAETLSIEEMSELSRIVDELAYWFDSNGIYKNA